MDFRARSAARTGAASVVAALAAAGLAGCAAGCGNTMGSTGTPSALPGTGGTSTGTSTASITATGSGAAVPMISPAGFDVSSLGAAQKTCFLKTVNDLLSPCGEAMTLAACMDRKSDCALCGRIGRLVYRDCAMGMPPEVAQELAVASILALRAERVKVDVSSAPIMGPAEAPVTIVEYSDFECPHCKEMAPMLARAVVEFGGKVKLHYKHFPLSFHEFAPNAAAAAIAAGLQGKFWEFHDKLFAYQEELSKPDLIDKIAKELALDVAKLNADRAAKSTLDKLTADYESGEALGIRGTPTVYINGRKFEDYPEYEQLKAWIQEELH